MKTLLITLAAGAAALAMSACSEGYYGHPGYGPGPVAYDGYYDGGYGSFYDGYWADDGAFYYSDAQGHPYVRDDAHHFRHDMAQGFHGVRGQGVHHNGEHRPG
jgi:hypothetical protein